MATILPFRDYDEKDVINLFAFSGTLPATKGTLVKIQAGFKATDEISMLGNVGQSYPNTVSERYGVAAQVAGVPLEAVTREQRRAAKAVNFGIVYGQTAHGLSVSLGIGRAEAQLMIDRYFDAAAYERELAGLPGAYAPPDGRHLLAQREGEYVGCVALRRIDPHDCEMKRMFLPPRHQGHGIGRALARLLKHRGLCVQRIPHPLGRSIPGAETVEPGACRRRDFDLREAAPHLPIAPRSMVIALKRRIKR